jgi:hypothetical protein
VALHPPQVLLALTALSLALSSSAREGAEHARSEIIEETASKTLAACRAHGCGCPHEEVQRGCCCLPEEAAPRRAPVRTRVALEPVLARPLPDPGLPVSSIDSFHCSGGRNDDALGGIPPVGPAAPEDPVPSMERAASRSWSAEGEHGPLFDLRTEPRTPPPRCRHESQQH